jgi:DNA-binding NtrC family response regulator
VHRERTAETSAAVIVAENAYLRGALARLLRREGFSTTCFATLEEAEEHVCSNGHLALVLVEVAGSLLDPFGPTTELVERFLALRRHAPMICIAPTGLSYEVAHLARRVEASAVVEKPVNLGELASALRQLAA